VVASHIVIDYRYENYMHACIILYESNVTFLDTFYCRAINGDFILTGLFRFECSESLSCHMAQ